MRARAASASAAKTSSCATLGALGRNTVAMERSVEFRGAAAHNFTTDMRFTICNMTAEFGGLNGIFEADEIVADWLAHRRRGYNDTALYFRADDDAPYLAHYPIDLDQPRAAGRQTLLARQRLRCDASWPASRSMARSSAPAPPPRRSWRWPALVLEAALAEGAHAQGDARGPPHRRPGRPVDPEEPGETGIWEIYERAGFTVDPPNCSMCLGIASRKAGKGEVWLSSQNRNFENRMGEGSLAWLASAATVAASALDMQRRPTRARCWSAWTATGWTRILQRKRTRALPEITTAEPQMHVEPQQRRRATQAAAAGGTIARGGCSASATRWIPTPSSPASSAT